MMLNHHWRIHCGKETVMPEWTREQQTERVRRRIRAAQDPDRYNYTPAKENNEYADINKNL